MNNFFLQNGKNFLSFEVSINEHDNRNIWLLKVLNYIIFSSISNNQLSNYSIIELYNKNININSTISDAFNFNNNYNGEQYFNNNTSVPYFYELFPTMNNTNFLMSTKLIVMLKTESNFSHTLSAYNSTEKVIESKMRIVKWRNPLYFILFVSLCLTTVAGNCLVVIAVCTKKYLRNPTGYLIVSLAIADLIVGLVVMPLNSLYEMTNHAWLLGTFNFFFIY